MSRLYEREIKDFFEVAKIKMAGTTKEAKGKFGKSWDSRVCSMFVFCDCYVPLVTSVFVFVFLPFHWNFTVWKIFNQYLHCAVTQQLLEYLCKNIESLV